MASPLQAINAARRPVVVYAPRGRGAPGRGEPARPRTGPNRGGGQLPPRVAAAAATRRRGEPAPASPWAGFAERITSTKAAQEQRQQEQPEPEQGGFWGSDFGKGLGYVVNNPLTKAVMIPTNYLQTGGRAVTYGVEQMLKGIGNAPKPVQSAAASIPGLGGLLQVTSQERMDADKRSFVEKVLKPNTDYGGGQLLVQPKDPDRKQAFMAGLTGLGLDVLFDPLTYTGGAATRLLKPLSHADELIKARRALEVAEEAGTAKPKDLARMTQRIANLEEAAKAPPGPQFAFEVPAPRTRAERMAFFGEQSLTPEGNALLEQFPADVARGGMRGMQQMGPEARAAFGISDPGLRLRGFDVTIPGTAKISRGLNRAGGAARAGWAGLPGDESKVRNLMVPKGLEESASVLTRGKRGDIQLAATDVGVRNQIRAGSGEFIARQNRTLAQWSKENFKGKSTAERREMFRLAENDPEMGPINNLFKKIIESYSAVTGRELNPDFLKNPATYVPHKLNAKFKRVLVKALERNDPVAEAFMNKSGFYKDDLLEGSGYLERARVLEPIDADTPKVIDFGGHEVVIDNGTVDGLNNNPTLRAAFPGYEGKFFDDDPIEIARSYIGSLGRQAGRDKAVESLLGSGTPLVQRLEGGIEETRQAMNEALAMQNEGALLSTTNEPYVPGQPVPEIPETPVIPGSRTDIQRRKDISEALAAAQVAQTPEEAAAYAGTAAAIPPAAPQFEGIAAETYFRPQEGTDATLARAKQAKGPASVYGKAAAKDVAAAEEVIRESLGSITKNMVEGLRGSIAEQTAKIGELNTRINRMGQKVRQFGKITSKNVDEVTEVIDDVEKAIANQELLVKRKSSSWKGRATKAQKKVEREVRESLSRLHDLRNQVRQMVKEAPAAMRDELTRRTEKLHQPVTDATEALLRKEMTVAVPRTQTAVESSRAAIEMLMGTEGPDILRGRYNQIIADAKGAAEDILRPLASDSERLVAAREEYRAVLAEIQEIGGRRRNNKGNITKANQLLMDQAVVRRQELMLELGQTSGKAAVTRLSPYEDVLKQINDLTRQIESGVGERPRIDDLKYRDRVTDSTGRTGMVRPVENPERIVVDFDDGGVASFTRDEVAQHLHRSAPNVEALESQRRALIRRTQPGGEFAKEQQARAVLSEMNDYEAEVAKATESERAALAKAEAFRDRQQEAIVWANQSKTKRFWGEEEGWGVGERRRVEQVTEPPQPAALEPNMSPTGVVTPQRREAEAIANLENITKAREKQAQAGGTQLEQMNKRVETVEAELPETIARKQEKVAQELTAKAEEELGPMIEDSKLYTSLRNDLNDKKNLVVKRDENRVLRDKLNTVKRRGKYAELSDTIDEIEGVAKINPLLDDDQLTKTESILNTHKETLERTDDTKFRAKQLNQARQDAYEGKLGKVMIAALNDNWRAVRNTGPLNPGDVIMDAELYKRFTNLFELSKEPKLLGRTFNSFTNLFKTYATLSPGFHVRNTIGGIFMNTSDGVPLRLQLQGSNIWHELMKADDIDAWLAKQPRRIRDAYAAATMTGAGGRFEDIGVLAQTESRFYNALSSNPVTRWSQRRGTNVEGSMRMGMALHSIDRGESVIDAATRISRIHFDYGQISHADESIRRIIPFWTFMSRNLPLQIQQQWTNPKLYSYYNNLINNFSLPDEEFTPDYWTRQGAWRTPLNVGGNPIYLQPDLGFTRVGSDIEMMGGALEGEWGKALSNVNPMIAATADFASKRDSFYDRSFGPTDYTERGGVVGKPISALARVFNQTNEAGQVSDNFWNYVTSLAPPLNQIDRLLPELTGGESGSGTWTKRARYMGVPIQTLTPEAQQSEYWNQYYAMLDEEDRLRAMLQEAAG